MLVYVEGKNFLGKSFVLTCQRSDSIARVKAMILHMLHDIGRGDHYFRLKFGDAYLREPLTLQDYRIAEMSVLQMVPVSFGKSPSTRPQTTATGARPITRATLRGNNSTTSPNDNGGGYTRLGAHTVAALRKEVGVFKRRRALLETMKALLWLQLALCVGNFITIYWWSGLWTGLVILVALFYLPKFVWVGGSVGHMTKRDIYIMIGDSVCFLLVAIADVSMFLYVLLALVLPGCPSSSPHYNPDNTSHCSYPVWLAAAFFPAQTLLLVTSAVVSLVLQGNFRFQTGSLVEHTLTQSRDVTELLEVAQTGRPKDRRQAAFELSNVALLGETSKTDIAAAGGLQALISLATSEDEVTQEYATEALAELLTLSSLQSEFASQGGVSILCALLHSSDGYVVHQAACALSYLTAHCHGNRITVLQEDGLADLLQAYQQDAPEVQRVVGQILFDLSGCSSEANRFLSHGGLLDALMGRAGPDGDREVRVLSLRTLEELAVRKPKVVLERPQLIPHLLDVCTTELSAVQQTAISLLFLYAKDHEASQHLLSQPNLLTALKSLVHVTMTTSNQQLPLQAITMVETLMQEPGNRARLVALGVRGFLVALQERGSLSREAQAALTNCFSLLD